ncbi:MAG: hypothetical protein J0H18_02475 [Rhizobiales bacterium]|nr:hypothetical protein [Hyphomicrobiales bacterium]OJY07158.1 MAG: hypothetical protein BGP07_15885 [Rhizobiales bacterium 63-22]
MVHDTRHWPYVVTLAEGSPSLADMRAFFDVWNGWLDTGKRFVVIRRFMDEAALEHPEGAAREVKQWFQENMERIRARVMGMVTIVPESAYERMSRMDAEKLFRVPAGTFSNVDAALHWLRERVVWQHGLDFDRAAIRAKLLQS